MSPIPIQAKTLPAIIWPQSAKKDIFCRIDETGVHQIALRRLINRERIASAIDSAGLEAEIDRYPGIKKQIRIIDSLSPSPISTWLIHKSVSTKLRIKIREALPTLHVDDNGRNILTQGNNAHFARASDQGYDEIRGMEKKSRTIKLL